VPILTIIDEQRCALEKVEALAQLGLAEPDKARDALVAVLGVVEGVRGTIRETMETLESKGHYVIR
jgi:hypothetical protein